MTVLNVIYKLNLLNNSVRWKEVLIPISTLIEYIVKISLQSCIRYSLPNNLFLFLLNFVEMSLIFDIEPWIKEDSGAIF